MAVEIEAKMKLQAHDAMPELLRKCGALLLGECLETNTFYDTEDRALLAADEGLRVRSSRDLATDNVCCVLTHKGPDKPGQLKTREETELRVASAEDAALLLQHLGYRPYLSFQKRRQSWQLDGCKIELDELPLLGRFIEIEGPTEEAVMRLRRRLGLSSHPLIKTSYVAMLAAYLQERADPCREIQFPCAGPRVQSVTQPGSSTGVC